MKRLIQVIILLIFSIQFIPAQASTSEKSIASTTSLATNTSPRSNSQETVARIFDISDWLITDRESRWTADEITILQGVLQDTLDALSLHGVEGMELLVEYRFRHDARPYVDNIEGRMAKIDHNKGEITLSDKAFTVLNGFVIYHELGHAVDYRLDRKLTKGFHLLSGGTDFTGNDEKWQTADNYWLRLQGRDDPEEAAADAFAVLVMVNHAGFQRPIFAHQPLNTDYDGISAAIAQSLQPESLH